MEEGKLEIVPTCSTQKDSMTTHKLLECYRIIEDDKEEEDPRNIHVSKIEGDHDVVGPTLESYTHKSLKSAQSKHSYGGEAKVYKHRRLLE